MYLIRDVRKGSKGSMLVAAVVLAVASLAAGCGSSTGGAYGGKHPNYARALAGAPPPLAALYAEGNQVLSGGADAFKAELGKLRGHPVIVNKWASWCGPCRTEFPVLQQASARFGKRIAFL